ncbi:hypothetical protein [Acinetobacter soli]|uniref:hypothetical protein n=1 Tax=Acinetobacter soli TaxID=487316 RepID=UPI0012505DDB|nr:hypothetical protein [Acinetobacter soli]
MAGRKALVLTATDIKELGMHILSLPFKRRIEERCLHMLKNKKSLQDLNEQDRQLIQKCRYERNAYNKRMLQLQLIQQTEPAKRNALQQNILKLHQKHDIDAYFAMHDALDEILKTQRHQTAARNLNQKIEKALNPEQQKEKQSKKQQKKREDQIKYFIGSVYLNLLQRANFKITGSNQDLDNLKILFRMALTSTIIQKHQQDLKPYIQEVLSTPNFKEIEKFIAEAKQDPRNPFNKTPEQ